MRITRPSGHHGMSLGGSEGIDGYLEVRINIHWIIIPLSPLAGGLLCFALYHIVFSLRREGDGGVSWMGRAGLTGCWMPVFGVRQV